MKVALSRLLTDAMTLEIPRDAGPPHHFQIARGVSLRGAYESAPGATHLRDVAAESIDFSSLSTFAGSAEIRSDATRVRAATANLSIEPSGTRGVINASEVDGHAATVRVGDISVSMAEIAASALELALGPLKATSKTVRVTKVRLRVGSTEINLDAARVGGLIVESTPDGTVVTAEEVDLEGLAFEAGGATVRIERATLGAVRYGAGTLSLGRAEVARVEVSMPDLASPTPASAPEEAPRTPMDLGFLDLLSGKLDVDVHVDARLPVIHRRSAVHKLRVPIEHGVINFRELERNLSFLEDAVLDFEWKGDRLILEKDVPLIPFDNETLVSWELDADDQRLAKDEKARLRTLAHPTLPEKPPTPPGAEEKKPGFQLEKLDFDPISAALSLQGPAHVATPTFETTLGGPEGAAIAAIAIHGAVRHRPLGAKEPGAIDVAIEGISARATSVRLGSRRLTVASATIAEIPRATIALLGFTLRSAVVDVRGITLGACALGPSAP